MRATVWNEFRHEKSDPNVAKIYPEGMHAALAGALDEAGFAVRTATLDEPEHGLTDAVLGDTDVLLWWGHTAHGEVRDDIVQRVMKRVYDGMGLIMLHSGHASKIFSRLMGTPTGLLRWRENGERQRIWSVAPGHPITQGVPETFTLAAEETYGEYFHIPQPETLVFITWMPGGNVFRSGATWTRGQGRIFYFQPGHETFPTYYDPHVRKVIANAARWAAQASPIGIVTGHEPEPLEA